MVEYVIKRDGRKRKFNKNKIVDALTNAFESSDGTLEDKTTALIDRIANEIEEQKSDILSVEQIQDIVEHKLMQSARKDVAKSYILYRNERTKARERNSKMMRDFEKKLTALDVQNQNANVDEKSFGGRIGEATSAVMKQYALNNCMSEMAAHNHLNNEIYIHDLDHYAIGDHNCMSIPFDDLLAKGFNTRQTDVRPAQSINTAFQLVAVIFQLQSLQQFGGVSATHIDHTMVPYVRKSFAKHFKTGVRYLYDESFEIEQPEEHSIDDKDFWQFDKYDKAYQYAQDQTEKELYQAVEGLFHNLNTLQSRSGNQLPFTSINFGTCILTEGRMVSKALLEVSIKGIGKLHRTSVFPCSIFQLQKGVNRKPGDPNYDLFQLALKSTAQRLYPNYANVDWSGNAGYDPDDPRTIFSTINIFVA